MCVSGTLLGQKRASDTLEQESETAVSCLIWVLETESWFFVRIPSALSNLSITSLTHRNLKKQETLIFILLMGVLPESVSAKHVFWYPQRSEKGIGSPRTEVLHGCKLPFECWELNPDPLKSSWCSFLN